MMPVYAPEPDRVLMVTGALARGGAERQMMAVTHGLLREGYAVEIFELQGLAAGQAGFGEEFARLGVKPRRAADLAHGADRNSDGLDTYGLGPFVSLLPDDISITCAALARVIGDFRPSVVHCWSDLSNLVGGLMSVALGVPRIVVAQRSLPPPYWFDAARSDLYRAAYRALDAHPAVVMLNNSSASRQEFERWMGIAAGRIRLVYNGFLPSIMRMRGPDERAACRSELGLPADARVVGALMRFAPEKDCDLWLETAAAIAAARTDVRFVLAGYGHGNIAERMFERAAQLGFAERLVMPGAVHDIGQIYAALDVLLLTSRTESSPNVMIEAQAVGVPVVGPDVEGIRETMRHGRTGLLVRERSARALAAAVLWILDHPDWLEKSRSRGREFVARRFGYERMLREMLAIYAAYDAASSPASGRGLRAM